MKKAIVITAVITMCSLLCVIGFGVAAVAIGVPVAAGQIGKIVNEDVYIAGVDVGQIIDRAFWDLDYDNESFVADDSTSKTLDMTNVKRVELKVDAARVEITPVEGNTATVTVETFNLTTNRTLKADVSGDTARIESKYVYDNITSISGINRTRVYIKLPQKQYDKVLVTLNAGDLTIQDTACDELELSLNAGNTTIKNATADKITISCDAGNVDVKTASVTDMEIDVDAGNVDLRDVKGKTLNVSVNAGNASMTDDSLFTDKIDGKVDMGNIDLKLSKDIGFTLNYESDMGSFLNRFDGKVSMISSGNGSNDFISRKGTLEYLDGACDINLKINMGNITIK